ncbi:MAG: hypothetical protein ACJAS3_000920 [Roseivirga sp.]|jgi:hypothetical protein
MYKHTIPEYSRSFPQKPLSQYLKETIAPTTLAFTRSTGIKQNNLCHLH